MFRTPGISPYSEEIQYYTKNGAVLSSETELFFQKAKGKIYGITGSDGKTTTTNIVGRILESSFKKNGRKVYVGGNIGTPLVSFLEDLNKNDITVAELSSFQLMTMKQSPQISAITNITENHLDYHGSMHEYICAKCRIFSCKGCNKLVINKKTLLYLKERGYFEKKSGCIDNGIYRNSGLAENYTEFTDYQNDTLKNIMEVSSDGECDGVYYKDGGIYLHGKFLMDKKIIKIPGFHNVENYMTAIGVTESDASLEDIISTAKTFSGAEHRMEFVREVSGVSYYNSSIDSTPSRSIITLRCFEKPLTVICGGYDKGLNYDEFACELLKKADNIVITGASYGIIRTSLERQHSNEYACQIYYEEDFEKAVKRAVSVTSYGGKVLLSPACASFDSFDNFEQRGNVFKNIINML